MTRNLGVEEHTHDATLARSESLADLELLALRRAARKAEKQLHVARGTVAYELCRCGPHRAGASVEHATDCPAYEALLEIEDAGESAARGRSTG